MSRTSKYYVRKYKPIPELPVVPAPDWFQLINYFIRQGYPKLRIAKVTGMTREKVYSILRGQYVPNWHEGQLLLEWEKLEKHLAQAA